MIRPGGFRGAAFGTAADGDARNDQQARRAVSQSLGIEDEWAYIRQVHGSDVILADASGSLGEADAIVTTLPGLPVAIATADCLPVIVEGDEGVAVVHAGWRGVVAGVVPAALDEMRRNGIEPQRAAIGPGIGPCCYEVGAEVVDQLLGHSGHTTWGTPSVDLAGAVVEQLGSLPVWVSGSCTYTDASFNSYRRNLTQIRQVAVTWLPAA